MEDIYPKSWKKDSKPHLFCPGCGHGIVLKQLGYAIDEMKIKNKTTFGIDIGCSLLAWNFFDTDTIQTHHGRTTPVMVGYKISKPNRVAIAYMGDGGGYAIGLQSVLHAAYRNDPVTIILVNNLNYAMTGGQMSPTTLPGDVTATSLKGKSEELGAGLLGPELIKSINGEVFAARASVGKPLVMKNMIKKALEEQINNNRFSFLEILSICPTNWKMNAKQCFAHLNEAEEYYKLGAL